MKKWVKALLVFCFVLCMLKSTAAAYELPLNPERIMPGGYVPPDFTTKPPAITFISNCTAFNTSNVNFTIEVKVGDSVTAKTKQIDLITYYLDGQSNNTDIYRYLPPFMNGSRPRATSYESYSTFINLTNVPDGNHTLTVNAGEIGSYIRYKNNVCYAYSFTINKTVSINFTVDTSLGNTNSKPVDFSLIEPFPVIPAVLAICVTCGVFLLLVIKRKFVVRLLR